MKKKNLFINLLVLMILYPVNLLSQDWDQFRGSGRDSKVTGFKAPKTWPAELKQLWKVNVGFGDASPVLSGKKIYLATRQDANEVILCLDAATGKEIWKTTYPAPAVTGPASSHPGPRGTPSVADGKVVTFGVSGILTCLDASTGKVLWKKENPGNAVPQFFTGMSPLLTDGICIAHLGTKDKGEVVALDLATGNEKWKWEGDGPSYSSPSVMVMDGKKQIIVLTEKNLVALNLTDGKLLWQIPATVLQRFYNAASPYINGQIIYFTGQGSGTKAIQVSKDGDKFVTKELWSNPDIGAKWNTPVLKEGFLFGFTDQRRIYCINAATGATAWYDSAVNSDFATIVDCGSVLIGLPSTSNLIVFKPDTKSYQEVARFKVSETPIYAFPLIAGNYIYVKDAETLMLYSLE
ncbi:MAG: PQQ-binding-like beta-propeller repeat protein [Bacteroidales bacterium]